MFILERLINMIAPDACVLCGAEGLLICNWCWPDAIMPIPPRCFLCQKQTIDFRVCVSCRHKTPLKQVWTVTDYSACAKRIIGDLKFGHKRGAASVIGRYMAQVCSFLPEDVVVCHIPTAPSRVRARGFDQTLLIARAFAEHHKRPVSKILRRRGKSRQVGTNRKDRTSQLEGAFWVARPSLVKGKTIVLVDDVLTTGATLNAAARVLKTAGAKSVSAIVFARVK